MQQQNTPTGSDTSVFGWDKKKGKIFVWKEKGPKNPKDCTVLGTFTLETTVQVTVWEKPDGTIEARMSLIHDKRELIAMGREFDNQMAKLAEEEESEEEYIEPEPIVVTPTTDPTPSENKIFTAFGADLPAEWIYEGTIVARVKNNTPILIKKGLLLPDEIDNFTKIKNLCNMIDIMYNTA